MKTSTVVISASAFCAAFITLQAAPVIAVQNNGAVSIKKSVQNQTTNSQPVPADAKEDALAAKNGDVLKYVIEITNNTDKDLTSVKITDTLPNGIELLSDATQRTITEEVAAVKAGDSTTKQVLAKVTADKEGDVIDNQACYTASLDGSDKQQTGCDNAAVRIGSEQTKPVEQPTSPAAPNTPTETPAPAASAQPDATQQTEDLPTTGPSDVIAPLAAAGVGSLAYLGRLVSLKRRG